MIDIVFTLKSGKEIWCTPVPRHGKEITLSGTLEDIENGFRSIGRDYSSHGVLTMLDENGAYVVIISSEMAAAVIKEHAKDSDNLS